jgi:hypothetical protein
MNLFPVICPTFIIPALARPSPNDWDQPPNQEKKREEADKKRDAANLYEFRVCAERIHQHAD